MKPFVSSRRKYKGGSFKKFINETWENIRPFVDSEKLKSDIDTKLARPGSTFTLGDFSSFIVALNEAQFKKWSQINE